MRAGTRIKTTPLWIRSDKLLRVGGRRETSSEYPEKDRAPEWCLARGVFRVEALVFFDNRIPRKKPGPTRTREQTEAV